MSRDMIFKWAEAYFQCKVKKGEQLTFDQVINVLNDKWRVVSQGMGSMHWFVRGCHISFPMMAEVNIVCTRIRLEIIMARNFPYVLS